MFMRGILHTIFMVQSKVEPQNSEILLIAIFFHKLHKATYHQQHLVPPPGLVVDDDNDARGYQLCAVAPPIAAVAVVSPSRRQSPSRHPLPSLSSLSPSPLSSPSSPSLPSLLLPSPLRCRRAFCCGCFAVTLSIAVVTVGRRAVWPQRFGPPCCRAGTAVAAKPPPCCPCHCRAATTSAALPPPPPC